MWDKLLEFSQQLLRLKGQVEDNTSELTQLRQEIKRLGGYTTKLVSKIKHMEQRHSHEMQLMKVEHTAEIKRLEEQIYRLEENYTHTLENSMLVIENQVLKTISQVQSQRLLSSTTSIESESNSGKI